MGTDLTPLEAARMSTGNETGVDEAKDDGLRDFLMRHQHSTPFEMCELHLEVQAPIFVFRQWHRHRTQSYNEFSGRYAEMPDLFYVPDPNRVKGKGQMNKQGSEGALSKVIIEDFVGKIGEEQLVARNAYEQHVGMGIANELARINLPLSQYSKMRVKANLLNWFRFLKLRLDPHAQYEILVYAEAVARIISELWPKCWEVFDEHMLHAKSFSRSELEILTALVNSNLHNLEALIKTSRLNPSRTREFLAKIGR